ncbi:hypothetical protein C7B65_16630 [Phormidesmis priestleyi ULC007]|uniref:UmuC domain-containing protein n=1 Tax=Phormidesmis priestleyi ULC007 TaxID=1920490 RepID=A0A2T1DCC7_9CYAN|nr:hypothetical protein C7B65_16630 [Phormidesmis priestleyi ULC007]PZO49592.1 MAG: hypothetical protein DCF14_13600 [Phormidesmis priestleyi]
MGALQSCLAVILNDTQSTNEGVGALTRKTVHVDLDAFYASIEQRDNPRYHHTFYSDIAIPEQMKYIQIIALKRLEILLAKTFE